MDNSYERRMKERERKKLEQFRVNYENALKLIPQKLRREFQKDIMPFKFLESLVPELAACDEYGLKSDKGQAKRMISGQLVSKGFGGKLTVAEVDPETIFAELIRGIFDD
jgi:hypothetical protein